MCLILLCILFVKQNTAYEMRISDWSSDVCSSDLCAEGASQERSSHDTRLRTSSANIAFGQDSNNVSALCRLYRPALIPPHRLSRQCFGFDQQGIVNTPLRHMFTADKDQDRHR